MTRFAPKNRVPLAVDEPRLSTTGGYGGRDGFEVSVDFVNAGKESVTIAGIGRSGPGLKLLNAERRGPYVLLPCGGAPFSRVSCMVIDYASPGIFTTLDADQLPLIAGLPTDPVEICRVVRGIVIHPFEAATLSLSKERMAEKDLRPASAIVRALTRLDATPLEVQRPAHLRVVGTCRHFATLSCALLRVRGIPARARCGFATYFAPGQGIDHWVTEYWHAGERRWVRIDSQTLGGDQVARPEDLAPGQFLTGGEAWTLYRRGEIDPDTFGVAGTTHAWGVAEIRGNAIRDLAALWKKETLPWDEWGRMTASYEGKTGSDYDLLIDEVAATCAAGSVEAVDRLYRSADLRVPDDVH
ncbi:transglutaminase-like domain-containing protein [Nonomuraea fuscirosea]|uniref:transglutaminase-like domain-containing protein n=1 Tax=Nonomuraea fuscirosea TaxID=1291556 RepID=UPI003419D8F0